jgi:hypothetical protein
MLGTMAKKPCDLAQSFDVESISAIARELDLIAGVFRRFAVAAERNGGTLATHNAKSITRGLVSLRGAAAAVEKSIHLAAVGIPVLPGQLKPRSPGQRAATKPKPTKRGKT